MLSKIGITRVLTLTLEEPLPPAWFQFKSISNVFVPVTNLQAPTIAEMDYIYSLYSEDVDGFWLVHCGGGKGRAGTVLSCLLAMHGGDGVPQLERNQAIQMIRRIRPGSLESRRQEDFVGAWLSHRWKTAYQSSSKIEEQWTTLTREINPKGYSTGLSSVRFIMLVGLPGSGKSFVAESIAARRPHGRTVIISQDVSRSRDTCERQMGHKYAEDTLVILDCCNPEAKDRKYWLSLLSSSKLSRIYARSNLTNGLKSQAFC